MGSRRIFLRCVGWAITFAFSAGCGLFQPRDPREAAGPGIVCLTPNTTDDVVVNVTRNYGRVDGLTCYISMLDAAFAFHPDPADSLEALPDTVYSNWTATVESRDATSLAERDTFSVAAFDTEYTARVISGDGRREIHFYRYHLIVHVAATTDTLFRGLADITFQQDVADRWRITEWVDKRDGSGARTWGYLRRLFRVGF